MDGMGQVSRMVAIVALLLLIAPQPALLNSDSSDESLEAEAIDKEIEEAMGNMQALFEFGSGITGKESRQISKAFEKLSNYIEKISKPKRKSSLEDHNDKVFNIKPDENVKIRFAYQLPKGIKHTTKIGKKKKKPEYFLNFLFNNYRNPQKPLDHSTLVKKLKMRRTGRRLLPNGMPNPYNYFPLKGEDM
ncbi:uncharacterized protein LOC6730209 isoform X2 [Drosophila simulans]|uniref:uncharacterized protein LOC6730209 isoform X2 n=1 Tax=Drosophila simulans TaxID=7240 RepID=UPI00078AF00E|nr:uncharacterized protein LOC6730209 isoform X2 [Drosophila simulans]KMZ06817.1 uncharacterized protein Dsimw501_GD21510, isoform B [Drosophila simulans]